MRETIKYISTIFLASFFIIGLAYASLPSTTSPVGPGDTITSKSYNDILYSIGDTGTTTASSLIYLVTNTNSNNVTFSGKLTISSATTTNHTITNLWTTNLFPTNSTTTYAFSTNATSSALSVTGGAHIASLSLTNAVPALTFTNGTTTNPLFLARGTFGLTQNGEIFINTNLGGTLQFREGGATRVLTATSSFSFTVASTTASENITLKRFDQAVTIQKVSCVNVGGSSPSVTYNLPHGTDRTSGADLFSSNQAMTNTTTGTQYYTFADATLAANEVMWLITSAQSGATGFFGCSVYYFVDS